RPAPGSRADRDRSAPRPPEPARAAPDAKPGSAPRAGNTRAAPPGSGCRRGLRPAARARSDRCNGARRLARDHYSRRLLLQRVARVVLGLLELVVEVLPELVPVALDLRADRVESSRDHVALGAQLGRRVLGRRVRLGLER